MTTEIRERLNAYVSLTDENFDPLVLEDFLDHADTDIKNLLDQIEALKVILREIVDDPTQYTDYDGEHENTLCLMCLNTIQIRDWSIKHERVFISRPHDPACPIARAKTLLKED